MQRQADAPPASDDGELEHWHFDLLCVPHDASDVDINKAFKREMLRAHPNKNGSENANGSENTARLLLWFSKSSQVKSSSVPCTLHCLALRVSIIFPW